MTELTVNQHRRRQRILESASQIFAVMDYSDVTVDMVAGRAAVARGTIYNYFGSKAGLYRQVLAQRLGELLARLEEALQDPSDPARNLRRCVVHPFLFFVKYPHLFLLWRREELRRIAAAAGLGADDPGGNGDAPARNGAPETIRSANGNGAAGAGDLTDLRKRLLDLVRGVLCTGIGRGVFRSVDPGASAQIVLGAIEASAGALAGHDVGGTVVRKAKEELYQALSASLITDTRSNGWSGSGNDARCRSACLRGARVLVTRRAEESEELLEGIRRLGGRAACLPMLRIGPPEDPFPLRDARRSIDRFQWIVLTSRNGARALLDGIAPPAPVRPRVAAVGDATAEAIQMAGWPVDLLAAGRGGAALAEALRAREDLTGCRIAYPASQLARSELPQILHDAGAQVELIPAYRTLPPEVHELPEAQELHPGDLDIAVFASPSAAKHFRRLVPRAEEILRRTDLVSIGATTSAALQAAGAVSVIEAQQPSPSGLLDAVLEAWGRRTQVAEPGS
ncbi:MAG: TetR family transcriptional regulator [Candidatus Eisenbacteria bacterium]|nr:TetR family transcriptional regulator [Candidatus Eisenbacteria bacterium]